ISVGEEDSASASSSTENNPNKEADSKKPNEQSLPWDRFRIVKLQARQDKRIVGDIKIAIYGKASQEQNLVASTSEKLAGDWIKLTPTGNLPGGEYAVVEMLGQQGINLYVWDFRVDPDAPANQLVVKPEPSKQGPKPETPKLDNRFVQPVT
ncbi:MAG: hypothetical protein M3O09_06300, partial [Acidobacteriota bacterium]|nr:hypothetical protein [Acidobacteriota bacterium]